MTVWRVAPRSPQEDALDDALARSAGVPRVVGRLLRRRGVGTAEEAATWLNPADGALHDGALLEGAEAAADLLVATARRGGRIVVFGDYDVDGVTAVAQLRAALRRAGADAAAFIPHRLRDGYGLRPDTVRRVLAELSPSAIVTVDCGITAREGVACAREAGVDVVVTDHHLVPRELPDGAIVVNPRQPGCRYPEKELAAAGIALKLAEAVARRAGVALSVESLLRAAALGTIADMVPLSGENRVIAARGLAALAACRAPGLRALLAEAGLSPGAAPTSEEVAFRVAPRLNAAGRLDTALLALSLFEERDAARAAGIARDLSVRNSERRALERRVVAEARARVEARRSGPGRDALIVEADTGWHRGVLGIAASRLAREYHRPVLLFGIEGDRASGSGRSIPGVSLHGLLESLSHRFTEFGGHEQAVGGSLPAATLEDFRAEAQAHFAERIPAALLEPVREADADLPLDDVAPELVGALSRLEPHGQGNARPVFLARGARSASPFSALGEKGLAGRLRAPRGNLRAVAWNPDAELARLTGSGAPMDLLYRIEPPRNGFAESIEIVEARAAENAA
jgi:single-stranded-DNA-specific exonuclease